MSKDHALHNERLCDLLLENGQFNDWVITTAFYAALHYVKHQMFPLHLAGKKFNEFEAYYFQHEKKGVDKHRSLSGLVCRNLKDCSGAYRWLLDAAKNSRYNNYKVAPETASKARKLLSAIKNSCTKP